MHTQVIIATFDTVDDARLAIERLSRAGIGPKTLEVQPETERSCLVSIHVDSFHVRQQAAELMRQSGARRIQE